MNDERHGFSSAFFEYFSKWKQMWSNKKSRLILIRYMLPILFVLVLSILMFLPLIAFQTATGESEMRSLFYWHNANFFGTEGSRGAYELLSAVDSSNAYYNFYRAVVTLYIVDAVAAFLGAVLTVLLSATAVYLLLSEEATERSRAVGRIFRVAVGNRAATILPYVLSVIPFLFPQIFAYCSTTLRFYDTETVFLLVDPLWIAVLFLGIDIALTVYTRNLERRSKWDIFIAPARRSGVNRIDEKEAREWEDAVKADASSTGFMIIGMGNAEGEEQLSDTELSSEQDDRDEADFGKEIFVSETSEPAEAQTDSVTDTAPASSEAEEKQKETAEMRRAIQTLFSDEAENTKSFQKKK